MTPEVILFVLLTLAPWHGDRDEHHDARALRLAPVANAIVQASRGDRDVAAALIAHGAGETRYARYVIEGRCQDGPRGAQCDPDRHGRARARGAWQVWRVACPEAYAHPDGSHVSIAAEARCAARLLRGGRHRCGTWEGAFASMGGGARCSSPRAPERVRLQAWARKEIHNVESKQSN